MNTYETEKIKQAITLLREVLEESCSEEELKELLGENVNRQAEKPAKRRSNRVMNVPEEVLAVFRYERSKSLSKLLNQIYEPMQGMIVKQLGAITVNKWLVAAGVLIERECEELGKAAKVPTEFGESMGIVAKIDNSPRDGRPYMSVMYGRAAQEYIVKNINRIIDGELPEEE